MSLALSILPQKPGSGGPSGSSEGCDGPTIQFEADGRLMPQWGHADRFLRLLAVLALPQCLRSPRNLTR